jgi:hypothetical protein
VSFHIVLWASEMNDVGLQLETSIKLDDAS